MTKRDAIEVLALLVFSVGLYLKDPSSVPLVIGGLVLALCLFGRLRGKV